MDSFYSGFGKKLLLTVLLCKRLILYLIVKTNTILEVENEE